MTCDARRRGKLGGTVKIAKIVELLLRTRREAGERATLSRKRWLRTAAETRLEDPPELAAYHDALMFLIAYPDDRELLRLAKSELSRVARTVRDWSRATGDELAAQIEGSGIAHTELVHGFTLDAARWLASRFPRDISLEWREDSLGREFDSFLPALVARVEADGTVVTRFSTREWFSIARGKRGPAHEDIAWLVERFNSLGCSGPAIDRLFEAMEIELRWRVRSRAASRTFVRFPPRPTFFSPEGISRTRPDPARISEPPRALRRLPRVEAARLIDSCRATLFSRARETDPLTYANADEVYLARMERGIDVAVYGMLPERRLPIDSFYGYVAARNRVPVAYGGGWLLLDSCQVGINVFDDFRGGESTELFSSILRVYRALFRPKLFTVPHYQIGFQNEEAIQTGAYWFYDRFGFRPLEPELAELAARERDRARRRPGYRTSPRALRTLSDARLALRVEGSDLPEEIWTDVEELGLRVSAWIGRTFGGDRVEAARVAARRVRRALGVESLERWPINERLSFESLAPLVAMVRGLSRWPAEPRRALVRAMRAKGSKRERTYTLALRRHALFGEAVREILAQAVVTRRPPARTPRVR
jgi:hypothetical protein